MKLHPYTYRFLLISFFLCLALALFSVFYVANAPLGGSLRALAIGNAAVYEAMKGVLLALVGAGVMEFLLHRTEAE